jgi:hypothetical protein
VQRLESEVVEEEIAQRESQKRNPQIEDLQPRLL